MSMPGAGRTNVLAARGFNLPARTNGRWVFVTSAVTNAGAAQTVSFCRSRPPSSVIICAESVRKSAGGSSWSGSTLCWATRPAGFSPWTSTARAGSPGGSRKVSFRERRPCLDVLRTSCPRFAHENCARIGHEACRRRSFVGAVRGDGAEPQLRAASLRDDRALLPDLYPEVIRDELHRYIENIESVRRAAADLAPSATKDAR